MFKDYSLQTTWGRALVALVVGVVVGSLLITAYEFVLLSNLSRFNNYLKPEFWLSRFPEILLDFGGIMVVVGIPALVLLHRTGFRAWPSPTLAGFAFPFTIILISLVRSSNLGKMLEEVERGQVYWGIIILELIALPLIFAATALTIWRIAYRRPAEDV